MLGFIPILGGGCHSGLRMHQGLSNMVDHTAAESNIHRSAVDGSQQTEVGISAGDCTICA